MGCERLSWQVQVPRSYRVIDPRSGEGLRQGTRATADEWIPDEGDGQRLFICCDEQC